MRPGGSGGTTAISWVSDNVMRCISRIIASTTHAIAEMDQLIPPGVSIWRLAPSVTGFPAWSRRPDYVRRPEDLDRGHADWVVPDGATNDSPRILYCHGGGYENYSPQDVYRPVTSRLARVAGMAMLAFDYRLAPEFRAPTQLDDAMQALRWLARNGPEGPGVARTIFLAGDSAGGGIALALAIRLRDNPVDGVDIAGISVVSPYTDLSCSGSSYRTRRWVEGGEARRDPTYRAPNPAEATMPQVYRLLGEPGENGATPPRESELSPLFSDLRDLPPTQIHVGDTEVMLSDATEYTRRARRAGSEVELTVWPSMWHCFTQYTEGCGGEDAAPLRPAVLALRSQGEWLRRRAAEVASDDSRNAPSGAWWRRAGVHIGTLFRGRQGQPPHLAAPADDDLDVDEAGDALLWAAAQTATRDAMLEPY